MGRSNIMLCLEERDLYCLDHVAQWAQCWIRTGTHLDYANRNTHAYWHTVGNWDRSVSMWRHVVWPPHIQGCPLEMGSDDNTKSDKPLCNNKRWGNVEVKMMWSLPCTFGDSSVISSLLSMSSVTAGGGVGKSGLDGPTLVELLLRTICERKEYKVY